MKRFLFILIGLAFLLSGWLKVGAVEVPDARDSRDALADSVMEKVFFFAPFYGSLVESYRADLYIKGKVDVKKKNFIIRYLPTMFRTKKHVQEYMTETYSDLHFISPNTYEQKVKGSIGTTTGLWEADGRLLEYFHINVYSPTLLYDKLISPLSKKAKKYYTYRIDSIMGDLHNRQYKVRFIPKNSSYQLVGGYLIVSADVWSIREMRFSGRSEMFRFFNHLKMGEVGASDEFLPVRCDVEGKFRFFGNLIDGNYVAVLNYSDIRQRNPLKIQEKRVQSKYDLTASYVVKKDTNAAYSDTSYFNKLRPIPLERHEQALYKDFSRHDSLVDKDKSISFWGQFGDALINNYAVDLAEMGNIRFSPLINPLMFGYSAQNGISYSQDFRYNRLFKNSRWLRIAPSLGYNFKYKELYWRIRSSFDYWPSKRGSFHLEVGNGNRIYSSTVLDELKSLPDSLFDFDKLNLRFYKDLYLKARHSWEVVNGLTLDLSLSMHRRTSTEKLKLLPPEGVKPGVKGGVLDLDEDVETLDGILDVSNSFAPGIRLTWTPRQYYYMSGRRKVNLPSKYPTISFDWERGIKGVLAHSGSHERFEIDVQHDIALGLMRRLYYRLGWGTFTKTEGLYFVDFANLWRSNLPTGWNDDFGGVFQLLDRRWYNSSSKYVRGHITYESPFLLIKHVKKFTQYVLNERVYLNTLFVPHLTPYVEVGYGIGTHVFDLGFFASFANWEYKEMGVKFTFELFNR